MKRFLFAVVVTALIASAALADDKSVSITFNFTAAGPGEFVGTYTLAGAINESGLATASAAFQPNDEGVLVVTSDKILHLTAGDIHLSMSAPVTFTGPTTFSAVGKWELTGGTGAYADIKGRGKCALVGDVSTGVVSGAYAGKVNVK